MSHFDRSLRSQFFLTGPRPCPYLPNRRERKLFTNLNGPHAAALHDELAWHGFRRSQNILYRPACVGCDACVSTRVVVSDFKPNRTQRKIQKKNADLVRVADGPWATDEQYALFNRYLQARHAEGGMADMDVFDYAAMVEDTPVRTRIVEYRAPADPERSEQSAAKSTGSKRDEAEKDAGPLVAACITDILADGLSLVYSFYDPELAKRSLGQHVILDHIEIARAAGLKYLYLGYWVQGSPKMDYKIRFQPAEILTDRGWERAPTP